MWLTIDVEEIEDMNFDLKWKKKLEVNYEKTIDDFITLAKNHHATAFVLATFAKKYPHLIKKLSNAGVEIGCHGYNHDLIYSITFNQWREEVQSAKNYLEELIGEKIIGYRAVNWSMPFEKQYYEELVKMGFCYSSSYFPMKNYMYGNIINKSEPFSIYTQSGIIEERPLKRDIIPFSGGFYLRVLPLWLLKILFKRVEKPIFYIHPYELLGKKTLYFRNFAEMNLDFFLAFYSTGSVERKLNHII